MEPLNWAETLHILQSMGIDLPETTKLSDAVLDKRLCNILDTSQYKDHLSFVLDLRSVKDWPLPDPAKVKLTSCPMKNPNILTPLACSVHDKIQRVGFNEAAQNHQELLRMGRHYPPTLYVNPFTELHQTLMAIGMYVDGKVRWCLLQDKEKEQWCLCWRLMRIRLRSSFSTARPFDLIEYAQWTFNQVDSNPVSVGRSLISITATPLEQKLLLKLLIVNAPLVPSDFMIKRQPGKKHFLVSVLLPTAPPNVWGDKLFLIKIQIGLGEELPAHMMAYDMKRSFQVFLAHEDDPALFMDMHAEMVGPRGGYSGIKMYRWAKRTGDWELNICLDRELKTEIKW
ncbi:hypothetical protein C8Q74DRAFT_1204367 [Fomes fomentarius]|nr:hypothetical protein C8Q74DRAFT_1204367 [Fomes fomentarius]